MSGSNPATRDEIYKCVMTTVLPQAVEHYDENGELHEDSLFDFIEHHFVLGNQALTPRLIMMWLQKVFEIAAEEFDRNLVEEVERNSDGSYSLVQSEHLRRAYGWLQEKMLGIFKSYITVDHWLQLLENFVHSKGKPIEFTYSRIHQLTRAEPDDDLKDFLAFLCHVGVLRCKDRGLKLEKRKYEIPVLLRKNWVVQKEAR